MTTTDVDDPHAAASAPIIVGVDGSGASDPAVCWAAETAARRGRRLRIVHGLDLIAARAALGNYDAVGKGPTERLRERGAEALTAARGLAHAVAPDLPVEIELSEANPTGLLIEASASAHMVVVGATEGVGTLGHLGSVLLAVVSHGHGSIVVVHDTATDRQERENGPVVVGIDGSEVSADAVEAAFAEADMRGAQLIAVHSWSDLRFDRPAVLPDTFGSEDISAIADRILAESLAGWQEKYPDVHVIRRVYISNPRHHLRQWSKAAQLVVVGSRGRGGFRGLLLGSTGLSLVQRSECPVMVVHPR
ncbi:universal stress protein [Nocardia arizonensis]|uniref:universal stress protein n=1 Tax=Nocardia arizonensis TaxID=1141647 RepID=UPI0006D2A13A|nr:universal stress protein [Nocardia arizonensis]